MSEDKEETEETYTTPFRAKKSSVARRISEQIPLPDEAKLYIKEMQDAEGKSQEEILRDLVLDGISVRKQELEYIRARKKVLQTITLDEAEQIMKKIGSIFGTWSNTPKPATTATEEKDEVEKALELAEKKAMKGLPPVTYSPQEQKVENTGLSSFASLLLSSIVKHLGNKILDKEHPIAKGIGKIIEEQGSGFVEDLLKMMKEQEEEHES